MNRRNHIVGCYILAALLMLNAIAQLGNYIPASVLLAILAGVFVIRARRLAIRR